MSPVLTAGDEVLLAFAGLGAGLVNGAAGGGTLISFPALLAVGYPALTANVTSTVGIWSGYLGGSAGFRSEVGDQRSRLRSLGPGVVAGAVVGGILLLTTPSNDFKILAPYLLLLSCTLFAVQPLLTARLRAGRAAAPPAGSHGPAGTVAGPPVVPQMTAQEPASSLNRLGLQAGCFLGAVYGAYFGAGLGVVFLAVLGLALPDPLLRINGLRSVLALVVNTVAVVIFVVHAHVAWDAAGLMAGAALVGGYVGARIARRVPTWLLRTVILALGLATAARLLIG
ncbi:MAG TPA: sulfite exporter TauE/SafE family protein [Acidimicrobiales bacterium]|jgi:hypothetical protein|nr:sulfite exporter TauE/SafE family protein [Acidimicrobiales bacterium]